MSRRVILRLTMPKDVRGEGVSKRGQKPMVQQVDIPVRFVTAKGTSVAATLDLIVQDRDSGDGVESEAVVDHSLGQFFVLVSGNNGQVKLQSVNPVNKFVAPKFAADVGNNKSTDQDDFDQLEEDEQIYEEDDEAGAVDEEGDEDFDNDDDEEDGDK